jgi:hypothetical protein
MKIHVFCQPGGGCLQISAAARIFTAAVADDAGLLVIKSKVVASYSL